LGPFLPPVGWMNALTELHGEGAAGGSDFGGTRDPLRYNNFGTPDLV